MWDLQYATNYAQALAAEDRLFETFPPDEHFLLCRDEHVMGEIRWYGEYHIAMSSRRYETFFKLRRPLPRGNTHKYFAFILKI